MLTTNVDHCFQKAGFDKHRLFYTQGDYGLWQCSRPCHNRTYDNKDAVCRMLRAQGYQITDHDLKLTAGNPPKMSVPAELAPQCPICGAPMTMNLRTDDTFVHDEGWYIAANRYNDYILSHKNTPVLYLELGVGMNTPGIVKFSFWRMTAENLRAVYACVNLGKANTSREIVSRSICIDGDIKV